MEKSYIEPIKVSVCISVHNTAKYLPRCLDSVCVQTLQRLEIVLVNNGSTDNSEEIMHDYARKYPERKFVIISQEDRSLAGGRQTGIDNSSGEYIAFLDADDFVIPEAYELLLSCAEREKVDIVEAETKRDGVVLGSCFSGIHNTHDVLRHYFTDGGLQSMLWLRLYRRNLFFKPVLPTIYTNNEDMFAMPCLFHAAKSVYFLKQVIHTYSTDNEGAVMQTETFNPELAERRFQSRKKALLSLSHFQQYVGEEGYYEYYNEHNRYKATYIFNFLLVDFAGKSIKDKVQAVVEVLKFDTPNNLKCFLHSWLPKGSINTYFIYRLLGLKVAISFNRIINK